MRVQNKTYDKNCVICNKEFIANRKHAETCSEACRAQKNANKRAVKVFGPAIIADATPVIVAETKAEIIKQVIHAIETHEPSKGIDIIKIVNSVNIEGHHCLDCGCLRDNDEWATCTACHSKPAHIGRLGTPSGDWYAYQMYLETHPSQDKYRKK